MCIFSQASISELRDALEGQARQVLASSLTPEQKAQLTPLSDEDLAVVCTALPKDARVGERGRRVQIVKRVLRLARELELPKPEAFRRFETELLEPIVRFLGPGKERPSDPHVEDVATVLQAIARKAARRHGVWEGQKAPAEKASPGDDLDAEPSPRAGKTSQRPVILESEPSTVVSAALGGIWLCILSRARPWALSPEGWKLLLLEEIRPPKGCVQRAVKELAVRETHEPDAGRKKKSQKKAEKETAAAGTAGEPGAGAKRPKSKSIVQGYMETAGDGMPLELPREQDRFPSPLSEAERRELYDQLHRALEGLDPDDRFILVGHHVDGLTHEEIADVLGLTAAAVKGRCERARLFVKMELEKKRIMITNPAADLLRNAAFEVPFKWGTPFTLDFDGCRGRVSWERRGNTEALSGLLARSPWGTIGAPIKLLCGDRELGSTSTNGRGLFDFAQPAGVQRGTTCRLRIALPLGAERPAQVNLCPRVASRVQRPLPPAGLRVAWEVEDITSITTVNVPEGKVVADFFPDRMELRAHFDPEALGLEPWPLPKEDGVPRVFLARLTIRPVGSDDLHHWIVPVTPGGAGSGGPSPAWGTRVPLPLDELPGEPGSVLAITWKSLGPSALRRRKREEPAALSEELDRSGDCLPMDLITMLDLVRNAYKI